MFLVSWNLRVQGLAGRIETVTSALGSVRPDLVTLQEVSTDLAEDIVGRLAGVGLEYAYDSKSDFEPGPDDVKTYGCVIASRWPISPADDAWRRGAPFPELLARATVHTPKGDLDVVTVHVPNGAGNGWRKIDTFDVLAAALRQAPDVPRVLTGDFNEPDLFLRSGQIVTFGGEPELLDDGSISTPGSWTDDDGVTRPVGEWRKGVLSVLAGASEHGLRDAYRALHGFDAIPVTYRTRANPRCFEYTFASRHLELLACGYFHDWRHKRWSDHSAMWTNFRIQPEQPPRFEWQEDRPTSGAAGGETA